MYDDSDLIQSFMLERMRLLETVFLKDKIQLNNAHIEITNKIGKINSIQQTVDTFSFSWKGFCLE